MNETDHPLQTPPISCCLLSTCSSVECICYIVQLSSSSYRFEMADGALINMTSPIAWALACPVCMSFMIRIAWPEATPRVTLAVIMLLEAVVLLGIVSGMTSNMTLKISTYVVASILYILMVSIMAIDIILIIHNILSNCRSLPILKLWIILWWFFFMSCEGWY